jgi:hypothetical protein
VFLRLRRVLPALGEEVDSGSDTARKQKLRVGVVAIAIVCAMFIFLL